MMLYYWLRLENELAFYVEMIAETLKDIRYFLVIFVMCIAVFANAFYALNGVLETDNSDSTEATTEPYISTDLTNSTSIDNGARLL
jgi:hypothetical protein